MGPRLQRGRLLELPILGALFVFAGVWLSTYHWSGWLLAALPIVLWLGLNIAGFAVGMTTASRRRGVIRERLAALYADGFVPTLLCEGDLSRGQAWAAFDAARGEVKIVSEEAVRSFALAQLGSMHIDEARRLGDPTPAYYSLSLYFGDPNAPFQADLRASIATTNRRKAERWVQEIEALRPAASRPPNPVVSA